MTEEDFVEGRASNEEYAQTFDFARRVEIEREPTSKLPCDVCGYTMRDHKWITAKEFEVCDIANLCEAFDIADLRYKALPCSNDNIKIYLVRIPPKTVAPPEDPCDDDFMEAIST